MRPTSTRSSSTTSTHAAPVRDSVQGVLHHAACRDLSPVAESKNKQFGTYIQDDWAVNDKLTLNLGVRWDYEKNAAYLDYVTPANVVAALNSPNPDPAPARTNLRAGARARRRQRQRLHQHWPQPRRAYKNEMAAAARLFLRPQRR